MTETAVILDGITLGVAVATLGCVGLAAGRLGRALGREERRLEQLEQAGHCAGRGSAGTGAPGVLTEAPAAR
jgi:hypothetical protein